jgi:hypothetical protein
LARVRPDGLAAKLEEEVAMLAKLRARFSYGNVVATLALFLSLGGGAYALSPQARTSTPGPVPHDGIVFFKKHSCPSGWTTFNEARGRYVVGLNPGGILDRTVGIRLLDGANRATGAHVHSAPPSSNQWGYDKTPEDMTQPRRPLFGFRPDDAFDPSSNQTAVVGTVPAPVGSIPGTNAPYVQLLACKKK